MSTRYILRFDDISPGMAWSTFLPFKSEVERLGIKAVLGVVPECRDPNLQIEPARSDFFDFVRKWETYGDTIAQHGTFHVYDSDSSGILDVHNRSEFAGHSIEKQMERLAYGKSILLKENVWQPYFMAPAHSFDKGTLDALAELKFQGVTDGYGFYPYRMKNIILVPQLTSLPLNTGFGFCTICLHINTMTTERIDYYLRFMEAHKEKFIHFEEAISSTSKSMNSWQALLRTLSSVALRARRKRGR